MNPIGALALAITAAAFCMVLIVLVAHSQPRHPSLVSPQQERLAADPHPLLSSDK